MNEDSQFNSSNQSSLTPGQPPEKNSFPLTNNKNNYVPRIVYILYLLSFIIGCTGLIGVIIAYIFRRDTKLAWIKEHYRFQIRTFWIGLLYSVISIILTTIFIGFILLFLTYIWLIIRSVRGWKDFENQRVPSHLTTWLY